MFAYVLSFIEIRKRSRNVFYFVYHGFESTVEDLFFILKVN